MREILIIAIVYSSLAAAQNTTISCDKTLAQEMGTGGGGLMFFLGFMVASVLALLAWFFLIHRPQGKMNNSTEPQSIPVTIQPPQQPNNNQQAPMYWPNQPQGYCYYYSPVPNGQLY